MPPITVTSRSECRRAGKYIYQITRIRLNSKKVIVKSEKNVSPLEKRWRIHRGPVVVGYRLSCSTSLYIGGHSTTAAPSLCIYTSRGAKRHKNSRTFFLFSFRGEEARSSAGCRQRNKTPRRLFFFPSFFLQFGNATGVFCLSIRSLFFLLLSFCNLFHNIPRIGCAKIRPATATMSGWWVIGVALKLRRTCWPSFHE